MDDLSRLLHPAVQSLLIGLLAVLFIALRRARRGLALAVLALGWIWLASTPALALRLRDGLVGTPPIGPARIGAIVVLGGGTLPRDGTLPADTRAGTALRLWREGRAPLLLVSGRDQADELARRFVRLGVPADDLRVENGSADTHENARDSAAMLKANGVDAVLLVSSDIHLRRAAGCFRHEGIGVVPVAADEDRRGLLGAAAWMPRRDALTLTARALHEYLATWLYDERGWL